MQQLKSFEIDSSCQALQAQQHQAALRDAVQPRAALEENQNSQACFSLKNDPIIFSHARFSLEIPANSIDGSGSDFLSTWLYAGPW